MDGGESARIKVNRDKGKINKIEGLVKLGGRRGIN
jgi:hypothetical protein